MKLIVGLGNPGEKYGGTRHNLGFSVVEQFLKDFEPVGKTVWSNVERFKSDTAAIEWQPKDKTLEKIMLAKPKTYMNNSGMAVSLLASFYKLSAEDIWVVHDEIDLPLGSMKIRFGGSSAGHRGIASIMQQLGTGKFWRFRLGIGAVRNKGELANQKIPNVDDYVLGTFQKGQAGKARELVKRASKAIAFALEEGLDASMNRFNTK